MDAQQNMKIRMKCSKKNEIYATYHFHLAQNYGCHSYFPSNIQWPKNGILRWSPCEFRGHLNLDLSSLTLKKIVKIFLKSVTKNHYLVVHPTNRLGGWDKWGQVVHLCHQGELTHLNDSWDEQPSTTSLSKYLKQWIWTWKVRSLPRLKDARVGEQMAVVWKRLYVT